ncbi:MAG: mechanosensitive ion channel family protein [Bacteroidetes bacterium]|nr:mechanosensitive ion channel family protein [Bacteroidota bacterium]
MFARWFLLLLVAATAAVPGRAQPTSDTLRADRLDVDRAGVPLDSGVLARRDSIARALDSVAVAALADTSDEAMPEQEVAGTDVRLYGREIFRVYGGLGALDAETRARRIGERLDALARREAFAPDSLRLVEGASLTTVQVGDLIVMSVTDADAAAQGITRAQAARYYAERIRDEVARVRERSTFRSVLVNSGIAAALILLLGVLLAVLGRLFRRLDARFLDLHQRRQLAITVRSVELVRGDQVARAGQGLLGLLRLTLSLFLVYLCLTTVLGLFPWTQDWSRMLLGYLLSPVRAFVGAVLGGLPDLFAIAVVVVLVRWAIRGSNWLFRQVEAGALSLPGFYAEFAEPTRKIVRFLLLLLGVFLAYPYTPIADSKVFQGLTVFLGILFSLGSSTAIANVVAGTVLTYTRSFQVGDRIRVGDTVGDVVEKTFLVTRLRTSKNELVSVPNSTVLSGQVTNYSAMVRDGGAVVIHTTVTIGYDVPWAITERLLLDAARRTEGVEQQPPPFVLQTGLGDFSVAYQLNAPTRQPQRMPAILSDLHRHIQDTFAEAGVEILSPIYEAHRDGNAPTLPPPASA